MTKQVLFVLCFFLVVAFLGVMYLFAPGNVTIVWLGYETQFSVIFGFCVLIFLVFFIFMFSKIISSVHSFVVHTFSYFQKSKKKKEDSHSPPPSIS